MNETHEPEDEIEQETDETPAEDAEAVDDAAPEASIELEDDESESIEANEDALPDEDAPADEADDEDEESPDALPELDAFDDLPLSDADIDIIGALEQVSALSDVIAEQEAREAEEQARIEAERRAIEEKAQRREIHYFPRPPEIVLERGQLASVIPALLLIIVGAYLTFITTSSEESVLTAGTLVAAGTSAAGLTLIAYWFSSGRWLGGSLFAGLSILLAGGTVYYLAEIGNWQGWPLIVTAVGAAAFLSALFSTERRWDQVFAGLLLIVAGIVGTVVTTEAMGQQITDLAETAGPVILAVIVLLITIPGLLRRRT